MYRTMSEASKDMRESDVVLDVKCSSKKYVYRTIIVVMSRIEAPLSTKDESHTCEFFFLPMKVTRSCDFSRSKAWDQAVARDWACCDEPVAN